MIKLLGTVPKIRSLALKPLGHDLLKHSNCIILIICRLKNMWSLTDLLFSILVFIELHSEAERILNVDPDFKALLTDCLKEPKSSSAAYLLQVNNLNNTIKIHCKVEPQ